jgi:hypothetical protein
MKEQGDALISTTSTNTPPMQGQSSQTVPSMPILTEWQKNKAAIQTNSYRARSVIFIIDGTFAMVILDALFEKAQETALMQPGGGDLKHFKKRVPLSPSSARRRKCNVLQPRSTPIMVGFFCKL